MRNLWIGSLSAWLVGAGLVLGQSASAPAASTPEKPAAETPAPDTAVTPTSWSHAPKASVGPVAPPACGPVCPPNCDPLCLPECPPPPPEEEEPFKLCHGCWVSMETLLWYVKDAHIREPLVTTSAGGFGFGLIGDPDTVVLLGGNDKGDIGYDLFVGGRLDAGFILNEKKTCAIEAGGFALQQRSENFLFNGAGVDTGILARPIQITDTPPGFFGQIIAAPNGEAVFLNAFPTAFIGGIIVESETQLWGGECNLSCNVFRLDWISLDVLGGVRYAQLEEGLSITDNALVGPAGLAFFGGAGVGDGSAVVKNDVFDTRNVFYGGQLGARLEMRCGCIYFLGKLKAALGNTNQEVSIDGSSSLYTSDELVATLPGGLLAQASNIGAHDRNEFTVVPEASASVGWHVTPCIRIYAGYTFVYWSDVVRPGDQIDRNVNLTQPPTSPFFGLTGGLPNPRVLLKNTDFYAHGMSFGVAFRF
jgi:hypothetical protein